MLTAMPVLYQPQLPPEYTTLQYEMIKEVRKAIKDYGLQSTYTMSLLEAIRESYTMTPYDWKALLKMILTSAQDAVWSAEYRDLVIVQMMDNITNANNIGIGMNELIGEGPYLTPQAQATLPRDALQQASLLSVRALRKVPETGHQDSPFAAIRQGIHELYIAFIDRLQAAVNRQVENEEAAQILVFQLAFENANADCKKALSFVRGTAKTLVDYIKACQDIGSEEHKANVLAAALLQHLTMNKSPSQRVAIKCLAPTTLCPRCKKGFHWSNQCRSKFDMQGGPLPGNSQQSARPGAPQPNRVCQVHYVPQPSCTCNLTHENNMSVICLPAPVAAQAWTWPQPPIQPS